MLQKNLINWCLFSTNKVGLDDKNHPLSATVLVGVKNNSNHKKNVEPRPLLDNGNQFDFIFEIFSVKLNLNTVNANISGIMKTNLKLIFTHKL